MSKLKLYFVDQNETIIFAARSKQSCYKYLVVENYDFIGEISIVRLSEEQENSIQVVSNKITHSVIDELHNKINRKNINPFFIAYLKDESNQWITVLPYKLGISYEDVTFQVGNTIHPELIKEGVKPGRKFKGSREVINGNKKKSIWFTAPSNAQCVTYIEDVKILSYGRDN